MAVLRPARLSVNINKVATLRNSRGGNVPDVLEAAVRAQEFGAEGITVHPRPDERHIRYADARALRAVVGTEYNIEGYPSRDFIDLVLECRPEQVTLVPDGPDVLTSNAGWDTLAHADLLRMVLAEFREAGIRTSLFIECDAARIEGAKAVGADRIELYTEAFAQGYSAAMKLKAQGDLAGFERLRAAAVAPYAEAAALAASLGLGINAGHDLNADNLAYFAASVPELDEVSIGHALIADALYLGLENTIQRYRYQLELGAQAAQR
jgi:pyridoxine 5-phosphate synthase